MQGWGFKTSTNLARVIAALNNAKLQGYLTKSQENIPLKYLNLKMVKRKSRFTKKESYVGSRYIKKENKSLLWMQIVVTKGSIMSLGQHM